MGRRSICDPFDAAAIVERIARGETTAADAWRAYATTAVRPYARATFAGALSRARVSAGLPIAAKHRNLKRGVSGHEIRKRAGAPDRSRAQAGPVLVIGPNAALRVRGGALDVEHGSGKDRVHVRIDVDEPKPAAILFDAHGEFLTGEGIRWCARYAIPLILPNGPGRAILFYESALEADGAGEGVNGKHAARILDVGPSLVRAQALADPVPVARAIVSAKLKASAESVPAIDKRPWSLRLDEARSVAEMVTIEARIAAAYWRAFRDLGLRELGKGGDLPQLMAFRFANRQKERSISRLEARLASDQRHAQLRLCGRSGAAGASFDGAARLRPADRVRSPQPTNMGGTRSFGDRAIRAAAPLNRRAGVQVSIAQREFVRSDFPQAGQERAGRIDRSDHRRASAGFAVVRGNGTRTRRDGWRGRLQAPSNNV